MTTPPICVQAKVSVSRARSLMVAHRFRHLPVEEKRTLAGIVSIRDILPVEDEQGPVRDVMTCPVHTIAPHAEVRMAAERFLRRQISCLPVVDAGAVVGVLTTSDLLRCVANQFARWPSRSTTVAALMTARPLVTIGPADSLARAHVAMREARVRHLPVLQSGQLVGILSDRDVLVAGRTWLSTVSSLPEPEGGLLRVADAMSHPVVTVEPEFAALDAALILEQRRFGALPVMHGEMLVGMIAVADLLHCIVEASRLHELRPTPAG
jgi:CBS domain-containing protein